jgi:hypothetical protein
MDRALYQEWLRRLKERLTALYDTRDRLDRPALLEAKSAIFRDFVGPELPRFKTRQFDFVAKRDWNNASMLAAGLYAPDWERFSKAHACAGGETVGAFLESLKIAEESSPDLFVALDSLCLPAHSRPAQKH